MIVRNSQRVPPCSAREPRPVTSTVAGRGNVNNLIANPRLVGAERSDPFRDDAPDQPGTLVFIEFGRSGIAAPFQHFSFFHDQLDSQKEHGKNASQN